MLKIKMARFGKKKQPTYRLIINEAGRDTYGKALENLGNYDPKFKKLEVKADRVKYWISVGAQMTDSVNNLLIANKVIEGKMLTVSKLTKKIRAKAAAEVAAKQAAEAEAAKAAAEAAAAPVLSEAEEAKPEAEVTPEAPASEAEGEVAAE